MRRSGRPGDCRVLIEEQSPLPARCTHTGEPRISIVIGGVVAFGFNLQRELTLRGHSIPIIFIGAHKDEVVRGRAFQQEAVEFLFKPFSDTTLLQALHTALRVR